MKKCSECSGHMKEAKGKTPEGIGYTYYKCASCGEEMVDMKQLHQVAEKYRTIKSFHVKLSRWGLSLGVRIPKEIVKKYHLKDNGEIILIPEGKEIKLVPTDNRHV